MRRSGSDIRCIGTAVFLLGLVVPTEQIQGGGGNVFCGEAKMLHDLIAWSRGAKVIDTDHRSLVAGPSLPAIRRGGLYSYTLFQGFRKNAFAVALVLLPACTTYRDQLVRSQQSLPLAGYRRTGPVHLPVILA